jgi:hypothetical protein
LATQSAPPSIDPKPDENGYPTNPEYLAQQGLDLPTLNREFLTQQEQMNQLLTVLQDPVQSAEFIKEFQQVSQSQSNQRSEFPGAPPTPQQMSQQDLQAAYAQMQEAVRMGMPIDNVDPSLAAWDKVPDSAWSALAFDLIRGQI